MITELTNQQKVNLIKFRNDCLKLGLSTERITKNNKKEVNYIYKNFLKLPPPKIWYIDSPFMFNLILFFVKKLKSDNLIGFQDNSRNNLWENLWINLRDNLQNNLQVNLRANLWKNLQANLQDNLWDNLQDNLRVNLWENLWINLRDNLQNNLQVNLQANLQDNLRDDLRANLWNNLWESLRDNLWENLQDNLQANLQVNLRANLQANLQDNLQANLQDNLRENLQVNLRDNLRENLQANLWDNLWANLQDNLRHNFENIYWGNVDIHWVSYYIFSQKIGIKFTQTETEALNNFYILTQDIGFIWYYKNICFICDRPVEINKKGIQLHADGKPAIKYNDGYCIYVLNGINVPKEIAMTSWNLLDSKLILSEKNAEIRREIVRKIGIEKICKDLNAKTIDIREDYELLILNTENQKRPYLKMKNPSIGCYHIEGVPPECDTIEKALNSRKPVEMRKIPINDIDGEDWYQQGDVCIWSENAKSLKSKPKILT